MNERYRKFVDKMRGPAEARRLIVECARRHGTTSAARWSGASRATVRKLVRRAGEGRPVANDPGHPLSRAKRRGIVEAKRAHPDEGAGLFFKNSRVPYCYRTIFRVLHEAGLLKRIRVPTRDPDHWILWHGKQRLFAKIELCLGLAARLKGYTGRIADTGTPLRRLRRSERRLEYWRALGGKPEGADKLDAADAEMDACLARLAELAASALQRTLADIQHKG